MKRYAIIDLGTNTFHLLVAGRKKNNEIIEIYRERIYVNLGQGGIEEMSVAAQKRAYEALEKFKKIIKLFDDIDCSAFATAAFRRASNAPLFVKRVKQYLDIDIQVISGQKEAEYIFKGVKYGGGLQDDHNLLMDIGGGSVEFISGDREKILWAESYNIGVSILKEKFHISDPISKEDIADLKAFLKSTLTDLQVNIDQYNYDTIIGCSGTFDVLALVLPHGNNIGENVLVNTNDFKIYIKSVLKYKLDEIISKTKIPDSRAELVIVALLLIEQVISMGTFKHILISPNALKEGVISDMIANQ